MLHGLMTNIHHPNPLHRKHQLITLTNMVGHGKSYIGRATHRHQSNWLVQLTQRCCRDSMVPRVVDAAHPAGSLPLPNGVRRSAQSQICSHIIPLDHATDQANLQINLMENRAEIWIRTVSAQEDLIEELTINLAGISSCTTSLLYFIHLASTTTAAARSA